MKLTDYEDNEDVKVLRKFREMLDELLSNSRDTQTLHSFATKHELPVKNLQRAANGKNMKFQNVRKLVAALQNAGGFSELNAEDFVSRLHPKTSLTVAQKSPPAVIQGTKPNLEESGIAPSQIEPDDTRGTITDALSPQRPETGFGKPKIDGSEDRLPVALAKTPGESIRQSVGSTTVFTHWSANVSKRIRLGAIVCIALLGAGTVLGMFKLFSARSFSRMPIDAASAVRNPSPNSVHLHNLGENAPVESVGRIDAASKGTWLRVPGGLQLSTVQEVEEILYFETEMPDDFDFEATVTRPTGGACGLVFRRNEAGDCLVWSFGYRVEPEDMTVQGTKFWMRKSNMWRPLIGDDGKYARNVPLVIPPPSTKLMVRLRGQSCECYIDGSQIFSTKSLPLDYEHGMIGLYFKAPDDKECLFSEIKILRPDGRPFEIGLPTKLEHD